MENNAETCGKRNVVHGSHTLPPIVTKIIRSFLSLLCLLRARGKNTAPTLIDHKENLNNTIYFHSREVLLFARVQCAIAILFGQNRWMFQSLLYSQKKQSNYAHIGETIWTKQFEQVTNGFSVPMRKISTDKGLAAWHDSPNFKIPIASSTQPARNAKIIANSGGLSAVYWSVSNAIRLVGPIETSFIVPKNTYISEPVEHRNG